MSNPTEVPSLSDELIVPTYQPLNKFLPVPYRIDYRTVSPTHMKYVPIHYAISMLIHSTTQSLLA